MAGITMANGFADELEFWTQFVNSAQFLDGWVPAIKTPELSPFVADFILEHNHDKVLDVGSGVVSILNGLIPSEQIIAVDPLGEEYKTIFDYTKHGICEPIALSGEELNYQDEFDIVHMSNAIDHSQQPLIVYENLLRAVKPDGYLIIQGFEYEARYQKKIGLHQWDFFIDGNDLCFDDSKIFYTIAIANTLAFRETLSTGRNWFIWITQKLKS